MEVVDHKAARELQQFTQPPHDVIAALMQTAYAHADAAATYRDIVRVLERNYGAGPCVRAHELRSDLRARTPQRTCAEYSSTTPRAMPLAVPAPCRSTYVCARDCVVRAHASCVRARRSFGRL